MLNQISIHELIQSLEKIDGKILIPDEDVNWLWDSVNHQYYSIDGDDREVILNCFESNSIRTETRRVETAPHTYQYVENIYIPIIRENGGGRLILKLSFDVTDKIVAEQAISEDRDKLANITQQFPDAIITLDEEHRVVSWNQGAVETFGYGEEEMLDQSVDRLFHHESPFARTFESLREALPLPDTITHPLIHCLTSSGQDLYCEVALSLIHNERTGKHETVLILRDRSFQKRLEDENRRTLDNLSKINQISALVHASLNLDEILNMVLVAVTAGEGFRFNRAFLFLLDETRTRLVGRKAIGPSNAHEAGILWHELAQTPIPLRDVLRTYKATHDGKDFKVNQVIASLEIPMDPGQGPNEYLAFHDAIRRGECILIRPDHTAYLTGFVRRTFETDHLAVVPLVAREPMGVLVVDNSITGRAITDQDIETLKVFAHQIGGAIENGVLYEKLQNKVEELEEAHRSLQESQARLIRSEKLAAIGELSAKMAHEIRNPLVAIGGFASMILDRKDLRQNEEFLRVILDESLRLERILNNTLTYARSSDPVKVRQPVIPIVENALTLISDRLHQANIDIIKDYVDPPPEVELDANQMLQALLNILINAAEAMPNGGQLFIRLYRDDRYVLLRIEDSGEGMEEEQLSRIFDPFYSTKPKGSGLGLVVVHDILERHGIEYEVHSKKKEGTSFILKLPS
jgi:hypothetical protein